MKNAYVDLLTAIVDTGRGCENLEHLDGGECAFDDLELLELESLARTLRKRVTDRVRALRRAQRYRELLPHTEEK